MARVTRLTIRGFRSIRDEVSIRFPENVPVILVGENNAGKSNIVRALELILGEQWPGSKQPEDHDFWGRDPSNGPIEIICELEDEIDEILNYNDWHITDQYCVFGEDFETTMRNSFRGYSALEEEARRIMGRYSKPLIARYVAHHLEVSQDENGWRKFMDLAAKLRNLQIHV